MIERLREKALLHRIAIQDLWLVIGVICTAALIGFEYEITGEFSEHKRLNYEELLGIGGITIFGIILFAHRRMTELEREIGRRAAAERQAHTLAHTDGLTGLANRRQFEDALQKTMESRPGAEGMHAVFMLDLNGFKKINDVYGHAAGDDVLVSVAKRLASAIRDQDLIARFGGDEFAVVARNILNAETATDVATRIIDSLEAPIEARSGAHKVSVGIGIALSPRDGDTSEAILRKADIALYRAKVGARSELRFFDQTMDEQVRERNLLERELAAGIGTDAIRPWYQPIVDLQTEAILGFEALARWDTPNLGSVPPDRFIPIAEEIGLIDILCDHLLRKACADACSWPVHTFLAFNISSVQLKDGTLSSRIQKILDESGLSPDRLEIEVTESARILNLECARKNLSELRELGVRLALDDFGTGYSSLDYLRNFRFDTIKIDRSFIGTLGVDDECTAVVEALSVLGSGFGLTITAEGVESRQQVTDLLKRGCRQGQGFLFSKAVSASESRQLFS